jgi:dephospho-CoA kinase
MALDRNAFMLGVTGSFGSGCSTMALALEKYGYKRVSLSSEVRKELTKRRQEGKAPTSTATGDDRRLLQDIGNELRSDKGSDYWARTAVQNADETTGIDLAVFDGIRNSHELEFLRTTFPNFILITVWCPLVKRFDRVSKEYGGDRTAFEEDDKRDGNEEFEYGQQVQLCVDKADIVIRNDDTHMPQAAAVRFLENKIDEYISLINGTEVRPPHNDELAMAISLHKRTSFSMP